MKEYLSVAYSMQQGELVPNDETLNKLMALVGPKRKVLCVGSTTIPLARTLCDSLSCEVTVIVDKTDYVTNDTPSNIRIVVDSLASSDLTKRFRADEFEVVILADALHQIKEYSQVLTNVLTYFSNAVVISVPQLFDNKQALINAQNQEIDRLKKLLRIKEESLSWYSKRLREHLVNHYKLEKTAKERVDYERDTNGKIHGLSENLRLKNEQYEILQQDRDRVVNELNRVNRYSADRLPKLLRYPVKATIAALTYGPFEPLRILKKKRA